MSGQPHYISQSYGCHCLQMLPRIWWNFKMSHETNQGTHPNKPKDNSPTLTSHLGIKNMMLTYLSSMPSKRSHTMTKLVVFPSLLNEDISTSWRLLNSMTITSILNVWNPTKLWTLSMPTKAFTGNGKIPRLSMWNGTYMKMKLPMNSNQP